MHALAYALIYFICTEFKIGWSIICFTIKQITCFNISQNQYSDRYLCLLFMWVSAVFANPYNNLFRNLIDISGLYFSFFRWSTRSHRISIASVRKSGKCYIILLPYQKFHLELANEESSLYTFCSVLFCLFFQHCFKFCFFHLLVIKFIILNFEE